jgi:RNase adapter protein RapZ
MTEVRALSPTETPGASDPGVQPLLDQGRAPDRSRSASDFVLITGMSGAGRSSALHALEDLGFEAVDNLPLSVLSAVAMPHIAGSGVGADLRPLAIGVDTRTRDFSVEHLLAELAALDREANKSEPSFWPQDDEDDGGAPKRNRPRLVFLDCDDDVLIGRYKETRRRHPLAKDRPASDGVRIEREMLAPLRAVADVTIDTSALSLADLRRIVAGHFGVAEGRARLTLTVQSFSFRHGVPREADLVFDVRFLRNPYYDPALRPLDGRDPAVGAHVAGDPDFARFFEGLTALLEPLLPRYLAEGKSYLTVAVGCTGGRHRSVYTAERLAAWANERGFQAGLHHRDVDRPVAAKP